MEPPTLSTLAHVDLTTCKLPQTARRVALTRSIAYDE
jgi:hypothetical protein